MTTVTSSRRTSRITPPRGYVAIKTEFISSETSEIHCVAREDMRIEGTNGAFVEIKKDEHFYLSRAASLDKLCKPGEAMFYIVLVDRIGVKKCSCAANKPCKHEIRLRPIVAKRLPPEPVDLSLYDDLIDLDNDIPAPPRQTIQGRDWFLDLSPESRKVEPAKVTSTDIDNVPGVLSSSQPRDFQNLVFSGSLSSYNRYRR